MQGEAEAEAVADDEREIVGLELEVEGLVLKDALAKGTEAGQGSGAGDGGVIRHRDDFGADEHGDLEAKAQGVAEGAEDAVDPMAGEERLALLAEDDAEPAGVALLFGDQTGNGFRQIRIVNPGGELPGKGQEAAAVRAFAELELAEGIGQ